MTSDNITKEELTNLLVEKHKNFVKEYRKEYDSLERISVLKEKQEQIAYWLKDSKDSPVQNQKYQQASKATEKEMSTLQQELKSLYESKASRNFGPPETDPKARYAWLKNQIKLHEESLSYWETKKKEIANEPLNAKKDEKTSAYEPLKKIKRVKKPKKVAKTAKNARKKDTHQLKDDAATE